MNCQQVKFCLKQLKRPRVILLSVAVGILCGLYSPWLTEMLSPLSTIFFSLLKMCALPIVMTAVVLSFARLWSSGHVLRSLSRIFAVFLAGLAFASFLGSTLSVPVSGSLLRDSKTVTVIAQLMKPQAEGDVQPNKVGLMSFAIGVIPKNIFRALSEGEVLGTLLFVILLGIAIGLNRQQSLRVLLISIEGLNEAFFRMIDWFTYLLPLALCSIVAQTASSLDAHSLGVFGRLFGYLLGGLIGLVVVHLAIAKRFLPFTWRELYKRVREPMLIALSSSSSLATLPSLTLNLQSKDGAERWFLDLMLPVGVTFCQQATVFFYSFLAVFVAKIYGISLGPTEIVLIGVGSYLHSLASAGLPAVASIGFMAAVFRPVGIPVETMGVVLVAVLPLLDPFLTLTNITGQVASVAVARALFGLEAEKAPEVPPVVATDGDLGLGV